MRTPKTPVDIEVNALGIIVSQIDALNTGAQARVIEFLSARYPQFNYEKSGNVLPGENIRLVSQSS